MAKYFHIMSGLRGCYMPDSSYVIKVDTRCELKSVIEGEVRHQIHDCDFKGGDKKTIAWAAAKAWREAQEDWRGNSAVIPFGKGKERPFSIVISVATRREWKDSQQD